MLTVLSIILGVLMIIGGVCCMTLPGVTFLMLGYIIGIVMVIDGVERFIIWFQRDRGTDRSAWTMISAIFSLLMGIIVIGNDFIQLAVDSFIVYMVIAWLIVLGVMRIVHAFQIRKLHNELQAADGEISLGRDWWLALIFGILLLICGIVGFFAPMAVAATIGIFVGIGLIISGVNMIHFGTTNWMIS